MTETPQTAEEYYALLQEKEVKAYQNANPPATYMWKDCAGHVRERKTESHPQWDSWHSESCWCLLFGPYEEVN